MFKIVINEIKEVKEIENGEYTTVDIRPYTKKEVENMAFPDEHEKGTKEVRGYAPQRTITNKRDIKILEQTVENLNIKKVIAAINDMTV